MSEQDKQEHYWKNCSNKDGDGCDSPAHVSYVWPGKEREYACVVHAMMLANVAGAMGMPLAFEPYRGEEALQRASSSVLPPTIDV